MEDEAEAEAGRLGMLAEVQQALQGHPGSAAVAEQAGTALYNLTFNEDNRAAARHLGLAEDLQRAMKLHGSRGGNVERYLSAVLSNIADNRR